MALCLLAASDRPVEGSEASARRFGLAHVELMDLHLERAPDGTVVERSILTAGELAERSRLARDAGIGRDRWSLYWDLVDRGSGYAWEVPDAMVARDVAAGLRPLVILQGTPARHATAGRPVAVPSVGGNRPYGSDEGARPAPVQASPPRGLAEAAFLDGTGRPTDDPAVAVAANPANPWAAFVVAAARRYRPGGELARAAGWAPEAGVREWEIGNEPNLPHFWSGSPEAFARYLEVAYLAIAWVDPEAIVLHGGIADTEGAEAWFSRFLDALRARAAASDLPARHGYYFDRTAWHWYAYPTLLSEGPERVRRLLADHALPEKPIWVTELGIPVWSEHPGPCWDPASPWRATVAEQAAYVWLSAAEAVSAGVESLVYFQAYDDCGNGPGSYDAFGFLRNVAGNQCWTPPGHACWRFESSLAGTPRPAYHALAVAARELGNAELLWRPTPSSPQWQRVLFYQPPDRRVTVAWSWARSDTPVELSATGPSGVLYGLDASGNVTATSVEPTGGRHQVVLPGASNRNGPGNGAAVLAGRPVILVERDEVPPFRARIEALPDLSPSRLALIVDAADGGTGIASTEVFAAELEAGGVPRWRTVTGDAPWTAAARGGRVEVPFEGRAGVRYGFAVTARDRAGNVTGLPDAPQATTRIQVPPRGPFAVHLPLAAAAAAP